MHQVLSGYFEWYGLTFELLSLEQVDHNRVVPLTVVECRTFRRGRFEVVGRAVTARDRAFCRLERQGLLGSGASRVGLDSTELQALLRLVVIKEVEKPTRQILRERVPPRARLRLRGRV